MAPLIQFRAGRCFREGTTNTVTPAPGRGLVSIEEEDGLLHFKYKDLEANAVVEDLILFPGDASFVKATERVHVLKFSSSSARSFFWHQDVDASHDDERARKVNELIGGQVEEESSSGAMDVEASSAAPSASTASTSAAADAFATPAPAPRAPAAPSAPIKGLGSQAQMAQLADILANIQGGSSGVGSDVPSYLLPDVLPSSDLLSLIASTPSLLPTLLPFLPSDLEPTEESVRRAITSPEFKRATASLDRALRTGALGPLVAGLGLPETGAHGVENFLEAIEAQAKEQKEKEEAEGKKDGSGEGKMETD
ncbi:proteasome complex subunit Rpn13 ubiquitin receptor-domain-containing protein [Leucosporidium creatinivorum]|uniref:Proteasome complex subunit Rpn13 ubiquitin receptor-domain-containing protein n=1 Tax=Leucosporidium creatinivorum TaxID=106004 RepID=A0A1Y2G221_9BASI|nr:proteasome complex subunit Rpn13 ubiquitin receptor-domain-containing protein [Leucosporidium creatinivorum]